MIKNRNQKIIETYQKGLSTTEVGKKFKLSEARVWQIVNREPNYCLRHSKYFLSTCPYCSIEDEYKAIYTEATEQELFEIGKGLSKLGRAKEGVLKKRIFVRIMREKFGHSFVSIGRMLRIDHTSVMNLYYN